MIRGCSLDLNDLEEAQRSPLKHAKEYIIS